MRSIASMATPWYLLGGIDRTKAVAAYQPIGAVDLAASKVNLVNPGTYDAATTGSHVDPTWDATNGWKREAGIGFLSSGVVPAASSWAFAFRFSDFSGANFRYVGRISSGRNMAVGLVEDAGKHSYYNSDSLIITTFSSSGVYCISGQTGYYNGLSEGTIPTAWTGTIGDAIGLLGAPGISTANWPPTVYIQAFAIYSATLTASQVAAVSAAMASL